MQMTATGIVVGTPCYLSPEQARGSREADPRSDLYAVGVMLYEAVTGTLPFSAQNVNDLLFKIVLEDPRPISEVAPDVDPRFAELIAMAMARAPENRFQTAADFSSALKLWAAEQGVLLSGPALTSSTGGTKVPSGEIPTASREAKLPTDPTHSLARTPGTWADSQISPFPGSTPKSRTWVRIGAALGVLAVGGAAFAVYKATAGTPAPEAAASATSAAASQPPSAAAKPDERPSPEPRATVVAPGPTPPIELTAPPRTPPPVVDEVVAPRPKTPVPAQRPSKPATAKKQENVEPKPAPAGSPATTGTGKKRRDFGY
jgi:serine/threonine-protein kinase